MRNGGTPCVLYKANNYNENMVSDSQLGLGALKALI